MCGDLGILFQAVVSPAFLNRFKSEHLDPSFRGTLGTRSGSGFGFALCPADLGLRELEGEETGRSLYMWGREGRLLDISSLV
jgi:hypothetical protein